MDALDFCRIVSGRPGPDGGQPWGCSSPKCRFERAEAAHAAGKIWS
jgi:hypothetical protein